MELLTAAAEAELPEAMDRLYRIYANKIYADDDDLEADNEQAYLWAKRRAACYTKLYGEENPITVAAWMDLAVESYNVVVWVGESGFVTEEPYYYLSCEYLQGAIADANKAWALCQGAFGEEHPNTIACIHSLASLLEEDDGFSGQTEQWQKAYRLRERAYALCKKTGHWGVDAYGALLETCLRGGKFERRLELLEENSGNDPDLCELALAYNDLGRYQQARALFEQACGEPCGPEIVLSAIRDHRIWVFGEQRMALLETEYALACKYRGEEDHAALDALRGLAYSYDAWGELSKAIAALEKYIRQCEKRGQYTDLDAVERLALIFCDLGDYENALALGIRYYLIQNKYGWEGSVQEQRPEQFKAKAYAGLGDYTKALKLQQMACDRIREHFGPEDFQIWASSTALADIYCQMGDYATAQEVLEDSCARFSEAYQQDSQTAIEALGVRARIRRGMGAYREAAQLQQEAYEQLRADWGEKHRHTLRAAGELANTYTLLGEYEKAAELEIRNCTAWEEMLGTGHGKYRTAANHLAYLYAQMGKPEKALEMKAQVLASRCDAADTEKADQLMALSNLAYDYRKSSDPAGELAHDAHTYALLRDALGEGSLATMSARNALAYACCVCGEWEKAWENFCFLAEQYRMRFGETNYVVADALARIKCLGAPEAEKHVALLRWML